MGETAKKILIYSSYWHIFGGGERYLLQIAKSLTKKHKVFLVAEKTVKNKAKSIFGIDLEDVEFLDPKFFSGRKFYNRYFFVRQFDVCFYMTDGSLFFPAARKNYLIIQSPMHIPSISISARFKISGWKIICYSSFMEKIIKNKLGIISIVLPPAVDVTQFSQADTRKEKIFLTVGRFFASQLHEKKHDFLIDFFVKNYKKYFRGWKLFICGNYTEVSGRAYLKIIKNKIKKLPVELFVNLPFSKLLQIYKKSSIYWHAAGFGSDPEKFPEKMEHFGITTIEAMSVGCVPIVYAHGGQVDIVKNKVNGFLWQDESDFIKANQKLLDNSKFMNQMSKNAVKRASYFSFINFKKRIDGLV